MRLALLFPGGIDREGSTRVIPVFTALVERLASRHDVHVVTLSQHPDRCDYVALGATVHDLGWPRKLRIGAALRGPLLWHSWRRVLGILREAGRFDAVHGFWAGLSGALAIRAARYLDAPCAVSLCGGELVGLSDIGYGSQLTRRGRAIVARTLSEADCVTAATQYMVELAAKQGAEAAHIPLGIRSDVFGPPIERLPGPPWRLLHVASLNRVKDQGTLLRALRGIVDAGVDAHLDIAGGDTLDSAVQAHCRELGLDEHVTLHGQLPNDRLAALYQGAHLFVMASRHEAAMVAAVEAAACGLPTVGTAVGHVADWAPEIATAVPVGDATALSEAVPALLDDGQRRAEMGRRAAEWAREHDADWTADAFESLYERLRDERGR